MKLDKEKIKKCPKCGASFACTSDEDCWCESLNIHKKEMMEIMENYTDCLCPGCLSEYAEK